jgi:hypothetical protein
LYSWPARWSVCYSIYCSPGSAYRQKAGASASRRRSEQVAARPAEHLPDAQRRRLNYGVLNAQEAENSNAGRHVALDARLARTTLSSVSSAQLRALSACRPDSNSRTTKLAIKINNEFITLHIEASRPACRRQEHAGPSAKKIRVAGTRLDLSPFAISNPMSRCPISVG